MLESVAISNVYPVTSLDGLFQVNVMLLSPTFTMRGDSGAGGILFMVL